MAYTNRQFPTWSDSNRFTGPTNAPGYKFIDKDGVEEIYSGALSYLQFINLVKKVWEESYPTIPILPLGVNLDTYSDNTFAIVYALELRKAHTTEPKPRMRQHVSHNQYTIYGQKFQNIISFSVMAKIGNLQGENPSSVKDDVDVAVMCDQIIEAFEEFMLEYTPIFKAAGASELVYSRRLSDSEINREGKDIHKKTVTYMLTTEKNFAIRNERIEKICLDIRTWMAYESSIVNHGSTPNFEDVNVNIIDLNMSATPNS